MALHLTPQQLRRAQGAPRPRPRPEGPSRLASAGAAGTALAFALTYVPLALDERARFFDHVFAAEAIGAVAAHFLFARGNLPRWALGLGSLVLYGCACGGLGLVFGIGPFGLGVLAALLPRRA